MIIIGTKYVWIFDFTQGTMIYETNDLKFQFYWINQITYMMKDQLTIKSKIL